MFFTHPKASAKLPLFSKLQRYSILPRSSSSVSVSRKLSSVSTVIPSSRAMGASMVTSGSVAPFSHLFTAEAVTPSRFDISSWVSPRSLRYFLITAPIFIQIPPIKICKGPCKDIVPNETATHNGAVFKLRSTKVSCGSCRFVNGASGTMLPTDVGHGDGSRCPIYMRIAAA